MLPLEKKCAKELALESGISVTSLKKWLRDANPTLKQKSKTKFQIVMETYPLNEVELAAYAREHGLFADEIKGWQEACKQASEQEYIPIDQIKADLQSHKKTVKILAKDPSISTKIVTNLIRFYVTKVSSAEKLPARLFCERATDTHSVAVLPRCPPSRLLAFLRKRIAE